MKIPERAEVEARKENEKLTESRGQNNFSRRSISYLSFASA